MSRKYSEEMLHESLVRRFWERVDKRGENECWPWKGNRTKRGYGVLQSGNKNKQIRVHRLSYEIAHNTIIPLELLVCHTCDNPSCANPKHLFLGTHTDNMRDKVKKGRSFNSHLTSEDIVAIRTKYIPWEYSTSKLAGEYNLDRSEIWRIITHEAFP